MKMFPKGKLELPLFIFCLLTENSHAVPNAKPTAELPCKGTAVVGEQVLRFGFHKQQL